MAPRTGLTLTEAAVLGLLTLEGERSGYDLLLLAHRSVGHVWAPAKSQLYATLERLARNGLARGREVAQISRPDKTVYRVTRAGRSALDAWLHTVGGSRDEQVLKMFLGGLTDTATLAAHLEHYRDEAAQQLEVLQHLDRHENTRQGQDFFHGLVLDLGLASSQASMEWAEKALGQLRAGAIHTRRAR
jgi:DNA-binding PadR family transcriptional regulator